MVVLLVVFSVLALVLGFPPLSQATTGVGILCAGCLLAALARIAQASVHHAALIRRVGQHSLGESRVAL